MMGWDAVTLWRRDGAGWRRSVFAGVRVEDSASSSPAAVGPVGGSGLKVYFFRDPGARPGDYIAAGVVAGAEPSEGARRVESVRPWTLRRSHHHTEVSCS